MVVVCLFSIVSTRVGVCVHPREIEVFYFSTVSVGETEVS